MSAVCGYCHAVGTHEAGCPVRVVQDHSNELVGLRAYVGMLEREITDLRTDLRRTAKALEALTIVLEAHA